MQDPWLKFKNDMHKIMQEIMSSLFAIMKEKLPKLKSQNSASKVVVKKKSGHSYIAKPNVKGVFNDDSKSNSSPPSKIYDQKVVNQEKGLGGNFFQNYMSNPQTQTNFS